MMWRFMCFVLVVSPSLLVDVRAESLNGEDPCQTPTGTKGTCVPVKNCSYVQKILRRPNFTDYDSQYLDSLKCGEMKVCCPKFENSACREDYATGFYFGEQSERAVFPWAGLLFYDTGRNRTVPKCGGTLVNERYVITAAHCTVNRPNWTLLFVRFNEFNTSSQEDCTMINDEEVCRYDYAVESIVPHPDYDMHQLSRPNDICIVRLAEDVKFNSFVKPICLPLEEEVQQLPIVNETLSVIGWDDREFGVRYNAQEHLELSGLDNETCNSVFRVANVTLTERQLCVGGLHRSGKYRVASGGPLMREAWGDWILVGVCSFGAQLCGTRDLPGVYTNVMKYLDWLEDEIFVKHYW